MRNRTLTQMTIVVAVLFFTLHLLTLNIPRLSGDEALAGVLILENFREILSGQFPKLNPVLSYLGPIDLWVLGFPTLLTHWIQLIEPHPWLIRIVPLSFYWGAMGYLALELRKHSKLLRDVYLVLGLFTPMAAMNARIGWAPALMLGILTLAWCELFHAERTTKVRWLRLGFFLGLAIEFHPTAWLAIAILFGSAPKLFLENIRSNVRGFLGGLVVWIVLAYPELRHFPSNIRKGETASISFSSEIAALLDILSGVRAYQFLLVRIDSVKSLPGVLMTALFLSSLAFFWPDLVRKRSEKAWEKQTFTPLRSLDDLDFLASLFYRHSRALLGVSLILLYLCYRSHPLRIHGLERYLLAVTPGWVIIFSGSIYWLYRKLRLKPSSIQIVILAISLTSLIQFAFAMRPFYKTIDPFYGAAKWLQEKCPASECLAYAEGFWNYWPIRFYTQDRIDINGIDNMTIAHTTYPTKDRIFAACYFEDSTKQHPFFEKWSEKIKIEATDGRPGQICYLQERKISMENKI